MKRETELAEKKVAKSNSLVRSSYTLTLNEQRLILLAIAGLNSKRPGIRPGLNQVDGIRVTAAEFGEAWQLSPKDSYKALKDASLRLFDRHIMEMDGQRVSKMRWVGRIEYHDGEGWAQLSFWPALVPHLTALSNKFTQYRLGQIAQLRSTYSIRLFEWCIQFSDTGWMTVTLEEIASRLEIGYTRFADLRRKVIEPAIEELRGKSSLEIDWKPVKEGRKVTAIRFDFKEADQEKQSL